MGEGRIDLKEGGLKHPYGPKLELRVGVTEKHAEASWQVLFLA